MKTARTLADYVSDPASALPRRLGVAAIIKPLISRHAKSDGATTNLYFGDMVGQPFFAASIYPWRTSYVLDGDSLEDALRLFINENQDLLDRDPRHCIGTWYVPESGLTYIDISVACADRSEALRLAESYNQCAIYDLLTETVVRTYGTGEELPGWPPETERLSPLRQGDKLDGQ